MNEGAGTSSRLHLIENRALELPRGDDRRRSVLRLIRASDRIGAAIPQADDAYREEIAEDFAALEAKIADVAERILAAPSSGWAPNLVLAYEHDQALIGLERTRQTLARHILR